MIFCVNETISGMYSLTRVMIAGGRTPKFSMSSKKAFSNLRGSVSKIFRSLTVWP